jgi:predicted GTPase
MSIFSYLTNVWDILKEADLRPLRDQALRGVQIAIVGAPGSGRSTLADQLRQDPALPHQVTDAPVLILDLDSALQAASADLIILMIDSRKTDTTQEQELVKAWHNQPKVLVFINR